MMYYFWFVVVIELCFWGIVWVCWVCLERYVVVGGLGFGGLYVFGGEDVGDVEGGGGLFVVF